MNKISKKIVSLVTMAAFALTLVPAAAFAADPTLPTVAGSNFTVESKAANQLTVTVNLDGDDLDLTQVGIKFAGLDEATPSYDVGTTYAGDGNGQDDTAVVKTTDKQVVVTYDNVAPGSTQVEVTMTPDGTGENNGWGVVPVAKDGNSTANVIYPATTDKSSYGVMNADGTVKAEDSVAVGTNLTTEFRVNDIAGDATTDKLNPVQIWATQGDKVVEIGEVTLADGTVVKAQSDKAYEIYSVANLTKVNLKFAAAGTYTLHAGVGENLATAKLNENILLGATVVTVTEDTVVDSIKLTSATAKIGNKTENLTMTFDESNNTYKLDLTQANAEDFRFSGIDTITLKGEALEEDKTPAKGQTINFTTTREDVIEFKNPTVDAHNDSDNTDNDGLFETTFSMQDRKNGIITITDEATGLTYNVRVIADVATADQINRTLTGGYVLAGNDSNWTWMNAWFTDAVQFQILDSKNDVVTGNDAVKDVVISVEGQPTGGSLTNDDLALKDSGNGVYTLVYVNGDKDDRAKDLIPGKYTVRVALPGTDADNATVTFNAAKFGKAQDTVLDVYASDHNWTWGNPNEEIMTVDDQITLGQTVGVAAKYVDANGIKIAATDVTYGFNGGLAVVDPMPKDGFFSTPADTVSNQALLGTEIEIVAYNTAKHQLVTKTLTLVPSYTDKSLEFDPVTGPINEDNKVTVSVVDENGKVQQVEGALDAWIADQSNEDAKISVSVNEKKPHDVQNGKGSLTVYSDQETTADIVVAAKIGNEVAYGTLEYTFGSEDPLADQTVVMTIDSTEYVVNNNVITGDAAPYIDDAWRTMVPIRALMEAFDAEVIWDEENPDVVTINFDGDTQIVMNVGDEAYTINGVDGEMDTVPVNNNGRVYVPIRFVAEGIGFHVTPLYNADGLTASVVFQR